MERATPSVTELGSVADIVGPCLLTTRSNGLFDVTHFWFLVPGGKIPDQRDKVPKSRRAHQISAYHPYGIFEAGGL
jgi:hypothetical protein